MPVSCGIHDSNASLLPHLMARKAPFSVVSTGTWVIIFSAGAGLDKLDPARDCLANVDAFARPVASARFMGGREYEMIVPPGVSGNEASLRQVLDETILLLPSVERTSGPFQGMNAKWLPHEPQGPARASAASLYLAMMTATSLELSGGAGDVIVEGPFAKNSAYLDMLAVATGRNVIAMRGSSTGTSIGASLLALGRDHAFEIEAEAPAQPPAHISAGMARWRDAWKAAVLLRSAEQLRKTYPPALRRTDRATSGLDHATLKVAILRGQGFMATLYSIKPAFQNVLRPLAAGLARLGATANMVTVGGGIAVHRRRTGDCQLSPIPRHLLAPASGAVRPHGAQCH